MQVIVMLTCEIINSQVPSQVTPL